MIIGKLDDTAEVEKLHPLFASAFQWLRANWRSVHDSGVKRVTIDADRVFANIDVAEMLLGKDADSTKANIDKFEAKWLESLQKAVEDKLNNSSVSPRTPVRDNMGQKHKNTKDMSLEEFINYKKNNQ